MRHLTVLAALFALLALAIPAGASDITVNAPCTNTDGRTVVTVDTPFDAAIETPVGVGNFTGAVPAGTGQYVIDLAGLEEGVRKNVDLTLSWDNPVSDYDLIVNGENDLSTANPENKGVANARHCAVVTLDVDVFIGVPIDSLNLRVAVSNF